MGLRHQSRLSIPQWIVLAYFTLILVGGSILTLPIASKTGDSTNYLDALFTATSALCVTGQVTLNTAEHWSRFGQTVIISLIEVGGIGFMTFWISIFLLSGHKPALLQRSIARDFLSISKGQSLKETIGYILCFSFFTQGIGMALLSFVLIPKYGLKTGLFYSLFHSISAFCNAGFDLFGDSLIHFTNQPLIILTIAGLIMSGGLGYLVWYDILTFYKNRRLQPYTKVVLITTCSIWLVSTILFAINEWNRNPFFELSVVDKWINYFFLAVTPRTAGYANIDYQQLSLPSILLTCILMFIGASSGSTAGGVKVSTIATFFINMIRNLQGKPTMIFKRVIDEETVKKAFFIIISATFIVVVSVYILLITETIPDGFGIEYVLIEVASCLGTVGLTLGLTPNLTSIGKIILIMLMFIGRVGLLTFYLSFSTSRKKTKLNYPEFPMMVG